MTVARRELLQREYVGIIKNDAHRFLMLRGDAGFTLIVAYSGRDWDVHARKELTEVCPLSRGGTYPVSPLLLPGICFFHPPLPHRQQCFYGSLACEAVIRVYQVPLNEWKRLPLMNACAIMEYTSSRRHSL